MTDRERLLMALLGENDRRIGGEVSVLDVMTMLYALGEEHRRIAHRQLCASLPRAREGHMARLGRRLRTWGDPPRCGRSGASDDAAPIQLPRTYARLRVVPRCRNAGV